MNFYHVCSTKPVTAQIDSNCQWKKTSSGESDRMESSPNPWSMKLDNRSGPQKPKQLFRKSTFSWQEERKLKCRLLKGWKVKSAPDFHLISGFWHSSRSREAEKQRSRKAEKQKSRKAEKQQKQKEEQKAVGKGGEMSSICPGCKIYFFDHQSSPRWMEYLNSTLAKF